MRFKLVAVCLLLLSIALLTFRLRSIPPGLETDESSIMYNSLLISRNLHDQNNRFFPFFILSSDHIDWKQPVLIYTSAIFFKILGSSLFTFKLVNVSFAIGSIILTMLALKHLLSRNFVLIAGVLLATTPMIIITARIGNESILPAFFSALWLLGIVLYRKTSKPMWVILTALALGIGFYSFKGMRIIVPQWTLLTLGYLAYKKNFKHLIIFVLAITPFFAITPLLEHKYPGAVFDRSMISLQPERHYLYYWTSNLGLDMLFFNSERGTIYANNLYGIFLFTTAPLFIYGLKKSFENRSFFFFLALVFLSTPLLFGLAGSLGYGHRLVAFIPLFAAITAYGTQELFSSYNNYRHFKTGAILYTILFLYNFGSFSSYYYFKYPTENATKTAFPKSLDGPYRILSAASLKYNKTSYVEESLYNGQNDSVRFFEAAYFKKPLNIWKLGDPLPADAILLTKNEHIDNFQQVDAKEDTFILLPSN